MPYDKIGKNRKRMAMARYYQEGAPVLKPGDPNLYRPKGIGRIYGGYEGGPMPQWNVRPDTTQQVSQAYTDLQGNVVGGIGREVQIPIAQQIAQQESSEPTPTYSGESNETGYTPGYNPTSIFGYEVLPGGVQQGSPGAGPAGTGIGGLQGVESIPNYQNQLGILGDASISGYGLNTAGEFFTGQQQDALADGGFGVQTDAGTAVVHEGPLGTVVTGNLGAYSAQEIIDYARSQGYGTSDTVAGAFGGPAAFAGAGGANYATAAEAAASLDAQDTHNAVVSQPEVTDEQASAAASHGGASGTVVHSGTGETYTSNNDGSYTDSSGYSTNVTDSQGNPSVAPSQDDSGDSGGGGGGTYCCTASVKQKVMTNKELYALHKWHHSQSAWWINGYDVWGKWVAKNLVSKNKYFAHLTKAFYNWKVNNKFSFKALQAAMIIYPGVVMANLFTKKRVERTV